MQRKTVTMICLIIAVVIANNISVFAQTNQPPASTIYADWIQIKNDKGVILASISPDGKVAISPNSSFDEVVNTLIGRIISQNQQFQEQMRIAKKVMDEAQSKANMTSQKALEIIQLWNPPPQPPVAIKTNTPVLKKTEVTKEESPIKIKPKAWYELL